MGDSDYSFSLTTFSPSGKLVQIEYALNAVASGSTSLGIKGLPSRFTGTARACARFSSMCMEVGGEWRRFSGCMPMV